MAYGRREGRGSKEDQLGAAATPGHYGRGATDSAR
jgi:hypothetical protein